MNNNASSGQATAVFFQQDCASPSGQHDALLLGQFVNNSRLALAESYFAFNIEDPGDFGTGAPFYFFVCVEKWHLQSFGQLPAYRTFAHSH
jgi:hypothetical protein